MYSFTGFASIPPFADIVSVSFAKEALEASVQKEIENFDNGKRNFTSNLKKYFLNLTIYALIGFLILFIFSMFEAMRLASFCSTALATMKIIPTESMYKIEITTFMREIDFL